MDGEGYGHEKSGGDGSNVLRLWRFGGVFSARDGFDRVGGGGHRHGGHSLFQILSEGGVLMKIFVFRSPRLLSGVLKKIFKAK